MNSEDTLGRISQVFNQHRHLLLFGAPGIFLLLIGMALGVHVVDIFLRKHALLVGSAMISVLLSIIGSLALFTGTILQFVRGLVAEMAHSQDSASHVPSIWDEGLQFVKRRPLVLFGGLGTILLVAGVTWGGRVVALMRQTRGLAMGSALICMLLSIIGSLGILAGIILQSVRGLLADLARTRTGK